MVFDCVAADKYDDPHASVLSLSFDEHSNAERAKETERCVCFVCALLYSV